MKRINDGYPDTVSAAYEEKTHSPDERFSIEKSSYVHWTTSDNRIFYPAPPTIKKIPPGVYEINRTPNEMYFEKIPVKTEGLLKFPETNTDRIIVEIKKFWDRENFFKEHNIVHRRGILLYGPPGAGKSCTLQLVTEDVIQRGGIAIKFRNPYWFIEGLRNLRQIQPETPVVTIIEDIDACLERQDESEILNILDGISEVNRIVFLATTNYPNVLGPRIVNRPSRFDKRFRIGYPGVESRKLYFEHLISKGNRKDLNGNLKKYNIDIEKWVKDTDEMSVAHLKELFVSVVILGDCYNEAIETLKNMKEEVSDKDFDSSIGFKITKSQDFYN